MGDQSFDSEVGHGVQEDKLTSNVKGNFFEQREELFEIFLP